MNPREGFKKTLELTRKIKIVEPSEKVLQSAHMLSTPHAKTKNRNLNTKKRKNILRTLRKRS